MVLGIIKHDSIKFFFFFFLGKVDSGGGEGGVRKQTWDTTKDVITAKLSLEPHAAGFISSVKLLR